jgi:hypothetical protein
MNSMIMWFVIPMHVTTTNEEKSSCPIVQRFSRRSQKYFVEPKSISDTNTNVIDANTNEANMGCRLDFSYSSKGRKMARKTNTKSEIPAETIHLDFVECCIGLGLFSMLNML